ncbi:MAG: DUF547 domain-containing protein [Saprospiraceae bacterium]|nr:DUF547 domain-containing protein [Saprospiraceae bacterium]
MNKLLILALSFAVIGFSAFTTTNNDEPTQEQGIHDAWTSLLNKHVTSYGAVDYDGFKKDISKLNAYIESLQSTPPSSSWSKNKEMAYWINLYNAFTIKLLVDNYPVSSIMDISGGKVWTTKKITVGGSSYTLDQIEKQKLIKRFNEPRVHFAVNCGAKSCPPLMNKAWTESNIQLNFDIRAKMFINNRKYNDISSNPVKLSKIFEWYKADFGNNLHTYINKYAHNKISTSAKIEFNNYDWKLNK